MDTDTLQLEIFELLMYKKEVLSGYIPHEKKNNVLSISRFLDSKQDTQSVIPPPPPVF